MEKTMFDAAQTAVFKLFKQNNWTNFCNSAHFEMLVSRRLSMQDPKGVNSPELKGKVQRRKFSFTIFRSTMEH